MNSEVNANSYQYPAFPASKIRHTSKFVALCKNSAFISSQERCRQVHSFLFKHSAYTTLS